jgi:thymidylate kinase
MSGRWVIFEGPDGVGKSTAANAAARILSDSAPTVLQHLTSKSEFGEYYGEARLWQRGGLNVVQDRCIVSDLVYAPVLRGVDSKFGLDRCKRQMVHVREHAVVLWFTAEEGDLGERLRERGDDLIDEGMLHAILKGYWRWMSWWKDAGAVIVEVDTTGGSFPDALGLELLLSKGLSDLAAAR